MANDVPRHPLALLVEHGFAGLPVVDAAGRVVGTFAEFDVLRGTTEGDIGTTTGEVVTTGTVEAGVPGAAVGQYARSAPPACVTR